MTDKEKIRAAHVLEQTFLNADNHLPNSNDYNGKDIVNALSSAVKILRDTVSEDLEKASEEYAYTNWESDDYHEGASEGLPFDPIGHTKKTFIAGANWKEEQFEKNRLAACDRQSKEDAEREQEFVMSIIKKEHRQPTFDDAIKYGMKLQKKQIMKEAVEVYVCTNLDKTRKIPCSTEWGGRIPWDAIFENCNVGDKVKMIIIKEDQV